MNRTLILASLLIVAFAAPASAERIQVNGTVRVSFEMESWNGNLKGRRQAQGMKVQACARGWFGIPYLKASASTDARGNARLRYRAKRGERITLRVLTDSSLARTQPDTLLATIFRTPHKREFELSRRRRRARSYTQWIAFTRGTMQQATKIQDAAHRTGLFGRRVYKGALRFNKIAYNFPSAGNSQTIFTNLVQMGNDSWKRDPEVVMHETAHTYWMKVIPIWNWAGGKHSVSGETKSATLALSEGYANYFGAWAGNAYAVAHGQEPDDKFLRFTMEAHPGSTSASESERYAGFGEKNEGNVMCALWDLTDNRRDSGGVLPGTDQVNGGGDAGLKRVFNAIKAVRFTPRLSMTKLYSKKLKSMHGRRAAEVLTMNGIPVE